MGSSTSIILADPLNASDITTKEAAMTEVRRLRAVLLANNDDRVTQLLLLTDAASLTTHHEMVLKATTRREGDRKKARIEAEKKGDYSKCFSGTADDTKNEAEAAALLKGGVAEENDDSGEYSILQPLSGASQNALAALEVRGKWMKYLNMNDCYGYVHGLTLEVRGNRPEAFVDEDDDTSDSSSSAAQQAKKKAELVRTIEPRDIKDIIDEVEAIRNKTLLLLTDGEHDEALRTYFAMHGVICDLAPLGLPISQQRHNGIRVKTLLEECRKSTVRALKQGSTMAIFIGDIDGEDMPIVNKLCKKPLGGASIFPPQLFVNKGKGLFDKMGGNKLKLNRLFQGDDKDASGGCMFKLGFQTVVISNAGKATYKRQLKSCFSLDNFEIVLVE